MGEIEIDCGRYYDAVGETRTERELPHYEYFRFERTLPHIHPEGSLLDIGCGVGRWLEYLDDRTNLQLSGQDISPLRLEVARRRLERRGIPLQVGDITDMSQYPDGCFDQVTALEVLEHLPDFSGAVDEAVRVASRRVVFTVPYREKLRTSTCFGCGNKAPINGHINSLGEDDFLSLNIDGEISFGSIPEMHGLTHYTRRVLIAATKALMNIGRNDEKDDAATEILHTTICPSCLGSVPYDSPPMYRRVIGRLWKLLSRRPAYLVVNIDK